MKTSSELKALAKKHLSGHYGILIGAALLYGGGSVIVTQILSAAFSFTSTFSIVLYMMCMLIISLLSRLFSVGYSKMLLNISRGEETHLSDLLFCFSHQPDRIILFGVLIELLMTACLLPGLLFLIPGVLLGSVPFILIGSLLLIAGWIVDYILMLFYSMVVYLYLDAPEKGVIQLMRESRQLMKGRKGKLFYLQFSFIGLILLSVLTCFIGFLWLMPYMGITTALFYRNIIGEV